MGIKNIMTLLKKKAPNGIKYNDLAHYKNYKIAFDTSMTMYQFLISMQYAKKGANSISEFADKEGNKTAYE